MTELSVSKSLLAKLLASENITVTHQKVKTAAFDLKNRTLILPIWNDMDGDLYDLLVGHEIGHALYTPEMGWHDAVNQNNKKAFKGFLNVIEDARIEKLAKRKYPGLGKSFAAGYKELYERDLFGIKKLPDVNKLNLIDRINIRFKVGAHVIVKFSDVEMEFVREIEAVETWEQVEDIANRVYAYVKEKEADKLNSQTDLDQLMRDLKKEIDDEFKQESDDEEESFDDDYSDDDMDSETDDMDGMDAGDDSESTGESQEEESEVGKDANKSKGSSGDPENKKDEEPESITDRNFREREKELVNESGLVGVFTLPEVNLKNVILDNKLVVSHLESFIEHEISKSYCPYSKIALTYDRLAAKCVAKFNKNNKKYIMHILKEFEMRKKAYQYARTTQARTGELNMNVLHNYKFSNDLFKKMNITGKAKNHGMILFLDMSGSMSEIFRNTVEQLLVLTSFCKLANIPFDVYGFSNDYYNPILTGVDPELEHILSNKEKFINEDGGMRFQKQLLVDSGFHLKHIMSSSHSAVMYRRSFNALCILVNEYHRSNYSWHLSEADKDHGNFTPNWTSSGFGLSSTPSISMLLASRGIINQFKEKHKRDVVNVIHLTDGEGDNEMDFPQGTRGEMLSKGAIYLVDKKTKKKMKMKNHRHGIQEAVTQIVRDVTGCKHIGFRLIAQRDVKYTMRDMSYTIDGRTFDIMKRSFRDNNFMESSTHVGYDKFYFIGASSNNIVDEELKIDAGMTKAKIASAFKKAQTGKKSNRILVSKFSEDIAA
jgi:hypothetical protein